MKWPKNKTELKCWECGSPVKPGEGIMTSCLERECYHEDCHAKYIERTNRFAPLPNGAILPHYAYTASKYK